jgi:phosphoribosylglycinamide formyltransferase-1
MRSGGCAVFAADPSPLIVLMKSIVILISGRGSNMEAIVRAQIPGARIAAVISNRPDAAGLAFARAHGIAAELLDHTAYPDRAAFDAALAACIDAHAPDLVVLAGFMRVLTDGFVRRYAGRLLNIHPSLLPSFPGLHTHRRALETGVRVHGASVHFVTAELDDGPIVIQAAVPVLPGDDESTLAARVLAQEHRIYPQAVRWFVEDRLVLGGGRVTVTGVAEDAGAALIVPAGQEAA